MDTTVFQRAYRLINRFSLALLLVLGGCLTVSAQSSEPSPITREALLDRLEALERDREQVIANINAYDGAIQECKYWIEQLENAEEEKAMIEFPKMLYKDKGRSLTVQTAEEEVEAKEDGWINSPVPTAMVKKDPESGKVIEKRKVSTPDAVATLLAEMDGNRKHPWSFDEEAQAEEPEKAKKRKAKKD